jgi:CHC2-type zinc finger protein
MSAIQQAKQKLTLPLLMQQLGLGEHANKSAKCPFHNDRHNSFSIWQRNGVWFFKCHTGCGDGDEINFLELHKHLSRAEAIKLFLGMAGVTQTSCNESKSFAWPVCVDAFERNTLNGSRNGAAIQSSFVSG